LSFPVFVFVVLCAAFLVSSSSHVFAFLFAPTNDNDNPRQASKREKWKSPRRAKMAQAPLVNFK
jgi:hypothetical protein